MILSEQQTFRIKSLIAKAIEDDERQPQFVCSCPRNSKLSIIENIIVSDSKNISMLQKSALHFGIQETEFVYILAYFNINFHDRQQFFEGLKQAERISSQIEDTMGKMLQLSANLGDQANFLQYAKLFVLLNLQVCSLNQFVQQKVSIAKLLDIKQLQQLHSEENCSFYSLFCKISMQILNFVPNSKYLENVAAMNEGIAIVEGIKQFEDFSLCRYKLSLLNKNTVFIFRNDPSNYVQFYTKAVKPLSLSNLLIDEVARSRMNKQPERIDFQTLLQPSHREQPRPHNYLSAKYRQKIVKQQELQEELKHLHKTPPVLKLNVGSYPSERHMQILRHRNRQLALKVNMPQQLFIEDRVDFFQKQLDEQIEKLNQQVQQDIDEGVVEQSLYSMDIFGDYFPELKQQLDTQDDQAEKEEILQGVYQGVCQQSVQLEHESAVHSLEKSLKSEHAGEDGHEATVIIVSDKHDDLKIAVLGEELHGSQSIPPELAPNHNVIDKDQLQNENHPEPKSQIDVHESMTTQEHHNIIEDCYQNQSGEMAQSNQNVIQETKPPLAEALKTSQEQINGDSELV